MTNRTIASVLVGLMLISGVASAQAIDLPSPGILPGSPFFFINYFFEGIGNIFTFGQTAKAHRAMTIAEKRLAAAQILAERGDENVQKAVELYEQKVIEAAQRAQNAQNIDMLVRVAEATGKHFAVLEDVIERVPEQAKNSVRRALQSSNQGQISALQALGGEDPARAADVGITVIKAHVERAKASVFKDKPEDVEKSVSDFQTVLVIVSDALRGSAVLAAKFSEELTGAVEGLDEAKGAIQNISESVREKINQAKNLTIDVQFASLREFMREDPEKAVDVFARAAEARLNAAKRGLDNDDNEDIREALNDYEKYTQFGQEISFLAQGIQTEETTVEHLVKKATSHHLQVLEDVRQKLPLQIQHEFQRAIEGAQKVQELRPDISAPAQSEIQSQQPAQPEVLQQTSAGFVREQKQEAELDGIEQSAPGAPQQAPGGRP